MNAALKEARGKVERLRKELHKVVEQAGPDLDMKKVTAIDGDSETKVAYFRALNSELDDAMVTLEPLEAEHAALTRASEKLKSIAEPGVQTHPGFATHVGVRADMMKDHQPEFSLGKIVMDSWIDQGREKHKTFELEDVSLKTLMTTAAGWAPQAIRTGRLVEDEQRPIQVTDIVPAGETSTNAVVYMEETTFTNAAAETAEAGTYAESALALTEQSSPVRKIATFLPVTDEQLDDIPQAQGYINNRLPFMLRQRLDGQVLNGNGTAPNLRGFLNVVGIQTQAKGTDPIPDAIYKAMVKIMVTGRANPAAAIIHPLDWQNVRLLRTADGIYIWGSPADTGPDRIWGIPVVKADSLTQGTALVGDFPGFTELAFRRGIEVKVSDSHGTFFIEGKQAIRADLRAALVAYRPTALCSVTGL